jgi:8-oxo-dGTP diphosphatase
VTSRHARGRADQARPGAEIRAAGAVLYRSGGRGVEVALIHRPRRDDWSFPKGKVEPGEHVLLAAVREVAEETGIRPVLGRPLATVRYQVEGRPKRVDYWASRVDDPQPGPVLDPGEVDAVEWLPVRAARERLTYAHDSQLLDRLVSPAGDGEDPGDTVPCILLRHASAGRKSAWRGDDLLRPLDERGQADAQILAELLACYAPQRVISSAAERCAGTVRPYAERAGAVIEAEPAFTVPSGNEDSDRSAAAKQRMTELLARPSPMVICAHRENLPVLLEQALAVLDGTRPAGEWTPPKAGFWVLHIAGTRLSARERHTLTS